MPEAAIAKTQVARHNCQDSRLKTQVSRLKCQDTSHKEQAKATRLGPKPRTRNQGHVRGSCSSVPDRMVQILDHLISI